MIYAQHRDAELRDRHAIVTGHFGIVTARFGIPPKSVTFLRNRRSRCSVISGHVRPQSSVTFLRNPRSRWGEIPTLQRIGTLVHFLDVGGVQPPEAVGIESTLAGLRDTILDDDQLLVLAGSIFDGLLASFEKGSKS